MTGKEASVAGTERAGRRRGERGHGNQSLRALRKKSDFVGNQIGSHCRVLSRAVSWD